MAADGTPLIDGFDPPDPPADGMQIVTPALAQFPAGGNTEFCYFSKAILDKETAFRAGQGFQAKGGHHAVVYWTQKTQPEQFRKCTEDDMVTFHMLSGGGGESGNGIVNDLPAGGAFHVPKGAQLVVNYHVLNAGDKPVDTQAAVNLFYGDPSLAPLTSFYVSGTTFAIPPHGIVSWSTSCTAKKDMQVARLLGHMHEHGTHNTITITPAGGTEQVVYDKAGASDFSYNPPYNDYPTTAPLTIHAGDKIGVTCTWNNTKDAQLLFPDEMCAVFGYVLGNDPEAGCADGEWNR